MVLSHREKVLNSEEIILRKDYCWMFEAFNQREIGMLTHLINKHNMKIDTGPVNKEGIYTQSVYCNSKAVFKWPCLVKGCLNVM